MLALKYLLSKFLTHDFLSKVFKKCSILVKAILSIWEYKNSSYNDSRNQKNNLEKLLALKY